MPEKFYEKFVSNLIIDVCVAIFASTHELKIGNQDREN